MSYDCSECMYPHVNIHHSSTRLHLSEEENRSKDCKYKQALIRLGENFVSFQFDCCDIGMNNTGTKSYAHDSCFVNATTKHEVKQVTHGLSPRFRGRAPSPHHTNFRTHQDCISFYTLFLSCKIQPTYQNV